MAIGVSEEEYSQLAVRFTDSEEKLLGSGTLVSFQDTKKAVVLTAAHVIHEKNKEQIKLTLRLKDRVDQNLSVLDIIEHKDYVHDTTGKTTAYDAAILHVSWEGWMEKLPFVKMEDPKADYQMILWGFPGAEAAEGMDGRSRLKGSIGDASANWWCKLDYEFGTATGQRNRQAYMGGFSGSGVYQECDYTYIYGGAISGGVGKDEAGSKAKITRASLFQEMLKEQGLLIERPVDLFPYMREYTESIDKEKAKAFVKNTLLSLKNKVSEENFLTEGRDRFATLPCMYDNHKRCAIYWDGQLTFLTACCGILEKDPQALQKLKIQVENEQGTMDEVGVKVLCTEERIETCIRNMIQEGYFTGEDSIRNNTVFLWANSKQHAYNEVFNRFSGRMIVNKIVDQDYPWGEVEDKFLGNDSFDIVNGQVENCNIGFVGLGKIRYGIIADGKGKKERMADRLEELLREAWEEDEE